MGLVYTDGTMCRIRLYLSDQRTAKWKIQAEKCKEKLSDEVLMRYGKKEEYHR